MSSASSSNSSETLNNTNVWSEKDINAMLFEEDVVSRKRDNENYNYSRKLKKTRMNMVKTSGFVEVASSHNCKIVWYYAKNINNLTNYQSFLDSIKPELIEKLRESVCICPIKINFKLESTYKIPHSENSSEDRAFKTSAKEIFKTTDIEQLINKEYSILLTEEDTYMSRGSGFTLEKIDGLLLAVHRYIPMGGSSYIRLPQDILIKRAIINPKNNDEQCFKWAILARYVTNDHKYRVGENYLLHEDKYDFTGITFPTPLNEIEIFEKNNPGVSVNVYALQKNFQPPLKSPTYNVYPLKVIDHEKPEHFDLLLLNKNNEKYHYSYISDFSRLVRSQKTRHKEHVVFCKRCFTIFDNRKKIKLSGQAALEQHKLTCGAHKPILPIMPQEGDTVEFEEWVKTQRHPIVLYADFEALLKKCFDNKGTNTSAFQKHEPMSYGVYVKASNDVPIELLKQFEIPRSPIIFRGCETREEVAKYFVETVVEIAKKVDKLFKTNTTIIMTDEERESHKEKTRCNLCKTQFSIKNYKVADHHHLSGKFRQTLCNSCNLKLQTPNFIPCFLHNLSNYDAHFIVRELGYDESTISVIPNSQEKFISFSKYINNNFTVRFVDTYRFMASSLSTLASNLITDDFRNFRETTKVFGIEDLPLVTRKGVFPYEYTDTWSKLDKCSLPPIEAFYSSLMESHINDEDYKHAIKVWVHFKCKTLGQYSDLYLKVDVLLLADIFENFRDICLKTYGLDPAYFYTSPGLSFTAMLKYSSMKLELLADYEMLMMFEKGIKYFCTSFLKKSIFNHIFFSGIRGGLTQASMRYARANNHTSPDFDPTKQKSWIIYQDANNLLVFNIQCLL